MNRLPLFALVLLALVSLALGAHAWSNPAQAGTPITISPSGEIALEVDGTQELTLSLGAQPSGDVTVILVATDPAVVGLSAGDGDPAARLVLNFPSADWQTAQTVTLTGLAPGAATIARQVSGGGPPSYHVQRVQVGATVGQRVAPQDDCSGDSTTTCSIAAPTSDSGPTTATGEIEVEGDIDWFSVSFVSGGQYAIEMQGNSENTSNTLDYKQIIGIYDSDGVVIPGTLQKNSYRPKIAFQPTDAATYYIALSNPNNPNNLYVSPAYSGTYTLKISLWPDDDCISAPSTACIATTGTEFNGHIQGSSEDTPWISTKWFRSWSGDVDWIGVDLTAGTVYQIDVEGQSSNKGTLADPGLYDSSYRVDDEGHLRRSDQAGIGQSDDGAGKNERITFKALRTDRYYFIVWSRDDSQVGTYALTVTELNSVADDFSDEQSGSPTGAIALTNGSGSATGEIEVAGDKDWFQVQLTGGQNYLITQTGRTTRLDHTGYTLGHPQIHGIYNSQGEEVVGSRYSVFDSWYTFTPALTGTYYILATGRRADFRPTGTYIVSVRQLPADDIASDTSTSSNLAVGGSVSGVINTTQDVDWHRAQLTGGTKYVFDILPHYGGNLHVCEGGDSNSVPRRGHSHCMLGWEVVSLVFFGGIHDSGGNAVSDGVTFGDNPYPLYGYTSGAWPYRVSFTPDTTGTYYVGTKTRAGAYSTMGEYTVSLQTSVNATLDDFPADASTTAVVTALQPLEGRIDFIQDVDYVKASLQPGKQYQFTLHESGPHDVKIAPRLYSSDGKKFYGAGKSEFIGGFAIKRYQCYEVETAENFFIRIEGRYFGIGGYEVRMYEKVGSCD